ncbi:hypothetical protein GCM10022223_42910 [Kineosporia mesophila]|uniref:YgiT-type zinc finger protein n=1 Tax=Kineosporia mesophila TaxID=566012 RepID=A0ABP6ZY21_9ACTN|nr:hypothetical protein [Kineosporia mesophila]MCD5353270.1 hypothetical protein [Kineosporia mesophila]
MKNSGTCPKCQGSDLIRVVAPGNVITIGLRAVSITRFICSSCGFTEEWVESRGDLRRLRDKIGLWTEDPADVEAQESIKRRLGL